MSVVEYIQSIVSSQEYYIYKTILMEEGKELFPTKGSGEESPFTQTKQPKDYIAIFIPFDVVVVPNEKIDLRLSSKSK